MVAAASGALTLISGPPGAGGYGRVLGRGSGPNPWLCTGHCEEPVRSWPGSGSPTTGEPRQPSPASLSSSARRVGSRTGEWLVASTCSGHCAVGARRKHHLLAHQGLSDGRRVAIDRATLLEADHDRGSGPRGREGVSDAERSELSTLGTWPRWAYTRVAPDSGTAGKI